MSLRDSLTLTLNSQRLLLFAPVTYAGLLNNNQKKVVCFAHLYFCFFFILTYPSHFFFSPSQTFLLCTYIILYILFMMTSVVADAAPRGNRDRVQPQTSHTSQPQKQIQVGITPVRPSGQKQGRGKKVWGLRDVSTYGPGKCYGDAGQYVIRRPKIYLQL